MILALISSALWGTGDFIGGTATRRKSPFVVVGWSQAAGLVCVSLVVLIAGLDRPWGEALVYGAGAAVFGYAGLVAFYLALARGTSTDAAKVPPCAAALKRVEASEKYTIPSGAMSTSLA